MPYSLIHESVEGIIRKFSFFLFLSFWISSFALAETPKKKENGFDHVVSSLEKKKAEYIRAKGVYEQISALKASDNDLAIATQNYLVTSIWINPAEAMKLSKQIKPFIEKGIGDLKVSKTEIELLDAAFATLSAPNKKKPLRKFENQLQAYEQSNYPVTEFSLVSQIFYTKVLIARSDFQESYEASTHLAKQASSDPAHGYILVLANLTRVASVMYDRIYRPSNWHKLRDMQVILEHTINMFPMQKSIHEFDPNLGQALAWHSFVRGQMLSYNMKPDPDHVFEGQKPVGHVPNFLPYPDDCKIDWIEKRKPTYSGQASLNRENGAVLYGYDLGPNGKVKSTKLLGAVMGNRFAPKVYESLQKMQADPETLRRDCLANNFVDWTFYIH